MTQKALRDGGFITERSLTDLLEEPVLRLRQSQDGYKHRARPRVDGLSRAPTHKTVYRRPGLLDYWRLSLVSLFIRSSCYRLPGYYSRIPDKRPPGWYFTMRNLSRQTNEPNFDDFYARTLSHIVSGRRGLSRATLNQRRQSSIFWLRITPLSTGKKQQRYNKLQPQKLSLYFVVHSLATSVIFAKGCALYLEEELYWEISLVAFYPHTITVCYLWAVIISKFGSWLLVQHIDWLDHLKSLLVIRCVKLLKTELMFALNCCTADTRSLMQFHRVTVSCVCVCVC